VTEQRLGSYGRCSIAGVQSIRKLVLLIAVLVGAVIFALTDSTYRANSLAHHTIRWFGLGLIIVCILGRTWSSLYVGGRKTVELVTDGPYSITRNPLYFFSILGTAGIGAQGGSVALALVGAAVGFCVFRIVTKQEEGRLLERHGQVYVEYLKRVPRFLPNPRLWHDQETLMIRQGRVLMTFADALLFLMAVPLVAICQFLQMKGILPILASLP
jgi:protein-S-isoprenylcysteine O-methyltransferase Ste14